jgi:hypothetical protein
MTLEEFEDALDRYGADFVGWPEALRLEAEQLLKNSSQADRLYRQAWQFDRLFSPDFVPPPPSVARIVARATQPIRLRLMARIERALGFDLFGFGWAHAGGLAACLLIGLAIGTATPKQRPLSPGLLDMAMGAHLDQADD